MAHIPVGICEMWQEQPRLKVSKIEAIFFSSIGMSLLSSLLGIHHRNLNLWLASMDLMGVHGCPETQSHCMNCLFPARIQWRVPDESWTQNLVHRAKKWLYVPATGPQGKTGPGAHQTPISQFVLPNEWRGPGDSPSIMVSRSPCTSDNLASKDSKATLIYSESLIYSRHLCKLKQ